SDRRDRQRLEGREPLGGRGVALARARGCDRHGAGRGARGGAPPHAVSSRRGPCSRARGPAKGTAMPSLRHADQVVAAGRAGTNGLLVPTLPGGQGSDPEGLTLFRGPAAKERVDGTRRPNTWPCALRTSTAPCAVSASARFARCWTIS